MSKTKTVIFALAMVAVLIVLSLTVFMLSTKCSAEEVDYSDLMPVRPEVATNDNAYTYFAKADKLVVFSNSLHEAMLDFKMGRGFETNKIEQILAENVAVIEAVQNGLKCDVCLGPERQLDNADTFPNISEQVRVMNLLSCKVKYERVTGDYSNAVDTCCMYLKYVGLRYEYPNSFVSYLV